MLCLIFSSSVHAIVRQTKAGEICRDNKVYGKEYSYIQKTEEVKKCVSILLPDFDAEKYMMAFCGCQNDYLNYDEVAVDESGATLFVPDGTYSFRVLFMPMDNSKDASVYVTKDEVSISEDTTLEFRASEATNVIEIKPLLPNGETIIPPLTKRIPGSFDKEIIETGNVKQTIFTREIFHEKYGVWDDLFGSYYRIQEEDGSIIQHLPFFLTNISSPEWKMAYYCMAELETGETIVTILGGTIDSTIIYSTEPKGYITEDLPLVKCGPDDLCALALQGGKDDKVTFEANIYEEEPIRSLTVNLSNVQDITNFNPQFIPAVYTLDEEYDEYVCSTTTAPLVFDASQDNKLISISYPYFFDYTWNSFMDDNNGFPGIIQNPEFSYSVTDSDYIGGTSSPFMLLSPTITDLVPYYSSLNYTYGGFGGEVREDLRRAAVVNVNYNGSEIFDSILAAEEYISFYDWSQQQFMMPGENLGKYEINFQSPDANETGTSNQTRILFDTTREDFLPPIITYLTVRDKDSRVTHEIASPQDGSLIFTAGDFDYTINSNYDRFYFAYNNQPSVTVEYAPSETEDYHPLDVRVDEEKFFMPGYGAFFECSFERIDIPSTDGLFDLRIKLEDTAGNSMTQTLSRAICIKSMTSAIESIPFEDNEHSVSFNSGAKYYNLQGVEVTPENLTSGVYIKLSPGNKPTKIIF